MNPTPGTKLGPYEILSPLGAGGMGEVYRARDTRLGRDVAVKVLPSEFAQDPERLRRFAQEAQATAALEHPNILAIYDIGTQDCVPYIVEQLLEGESLRQRLRGGPLPPAKAVEFGVQIAEGLAAAHGKGIVHRDLKPENLFITRDGRIKILDFGLARLRPEAEGGPVQSQAATADSPTREGLVLGTPGYMAPEQVRGQPTDARTDLFAFGCVLYEMVSGKQAFAQETSAETMTAILREEPPELAGTGRPFPPGIERIIKRCLEKEPADRLQAARDVAFALESVSQTTTGGATSLSLAATRRRRGVLALGVLGVAALLAAVGAGIFIQGRRSYKPVLPVYKRVTFRSGGISYACLTPDSQSVVYSASWEGKPLELFVQRLASADARSLGVYGTVVGTLGASAVYLHEGTLSQVPLEGGTPRDLFNDIVDASCDRSGTRLSIVRRVKGRQRLEYPVGKVLLDTEAFEGGANAAISPDGTTVAYEHVDLRRGSDEIRVVDASGRPRTLAEGKLPAWSPDGKEIWFSGRGSAISTAEILAVTLSGKVRSVARLPGTPRGDMLLGVAPDGRVLLLHSTWRTEMRGRMTGDRTERGLSWLDRTSGAILSPDGTQILFTEAGEGGGARKATYHWRRSDPAPKRLGDGGVEGVSPDWSTALVHLKDGENSELNLVPIGAGEMVTLPRGPVRNYERAAWHPDGTRIVLLGWTADGKEQLFVQAVAGGPPRPLAEALDCSRAPFSPNGRAVMAQRKAGEPFVLFPMEGGEPRPIPFLKPGERPITFSEDGTSLLVHDATEGGDFPLHVLRLDLQTGKREVLLELAPPGLSDAERLGPVWVTPNGRFYAYSWYQIQQSLYIVEGWR